MVTEKSGDTQKLLSRETRNSFLLLNKNVTNTNHLLSTVIQYNSEKLIEDEVSKNNKKVINEEIFLWIRLL